MPSFDIVSEMDFQEIDNALNQARREIENRYDFKGSKPVIEIDGKTIKLEAEDEYKVKAMADTLQSKLHRRGIDIKGLKFGSIEPIGGQRLRQSVEIIEGIEKELAKKIIKSIKDGKLKVQPQIMDDKIRVTSKKIDELQACINHVKSGNFDIPLQYINMRS